MKSIFVAEPIPNGFSWTITSKLGRILQSAEINYGERDRSFTILGVELNTLAYPQLWFPGDMKSIVIQITMECLNDMNRAVYQVSHEVIHCLSPVIQGNANWLEEGLATYFSIDYTGNNGHGIWNADNAKYDKAKILIEQILAIDPEIIKKLRKKQPSLSLLQKEDIVEINSNIPESTAIQLTTKF